MKDDANLLSILECHPARIGLINYPPSSRHVEGIEMHKLALQARASNADPILITVNLALKELITVARSASLTSVQLHGDETPEYCQNLRSLGYHLIKTIPITSKDSFLNAEPYIKCVDEFLFETAGPLRGGNGYSFDWELLKYYHYPVPFWLAGGLNPINIKLAITLDHPSLTGLDLNSGFETTPGFKDPAKIKAAINLANEHYAAQTK